MIAVLLAIKSMQLVPSIEAAQIIEDSSLTRSVARMAVAKSVGSVAFSPDGRYMVAGGSDCEKNSLDIYGTLCGQGSVSVREVKTGKEITKLTLPGPVAAVAFSSDGKDVVSGACENVDSSYQTCT